MEEQDCLVVRQVQPGYQQARASLRWLAGELGQHVRAEGQHLSFDRVRSLLVDTLTSTVTESEKSSMGGGFQPLSWWAQQGYDVEAVEARGEQKPHDVFGTVYYVGIEHKSKDTVRDTIHSQLLSLERRVKKRKPKQAKIGDTQAPPAAAPPQAAASAPMALENASASANAADGAEPLASSEQKEDLDFEKDLEALLEAEMEDVDLSEEEPSDADANPTGPKRKRGSGKEQTRAARAAAKAAAKAKAAADRQDKKDAANALRVAAAAVPKLTALLGRLDDCQQRLQKLQPTPTQEKALQEAAGTCRAWLEAASQCAGGKRRSSLDFDLPVLKLRLKTWGDLVAALRKGAPKRAAAKKAAKGGA